MTSPGELLVIVLVAGAIWFGLFRTGAGRRLRGRIASNAAAAQSGEVPPQRETTMNEDHEFLLVRCNGDEAEVARRLEVETRKNPNLTDEEVYRRAVRAWFLEKRGGTHQTIAEELDDTWL